MSEHPAFGIHDMPMDAYAMAHGVSASMLTVLREKTPLHLWWQLNKEKPEPTAAQAFGTLVHASVFSPESKLFHVRPADLKFTTRAGMEWQKEHLDLPIIPEREAKSIDSIKTAIHKHPIAGRLLKNAAFEQSIFVEDSHGTIRKARPDILPSGGNILPDLKTCDSAAPDDFERAIGAYAYYAAGAYYLDACKLAGREFEAFVLIAAEKSPPYAIACYRIESLAISLGRVQYERDLAIYRECVASGKWPGYPEKIMAISVPPWMQRALENV